MSLKLSGWNQSTAANIRVKLKSRNRAAHTVKQGGFNATEAERANTGERRAAQRLRHTAQTGIKELEGKERKGGWNKEAEITPFLIYVRQRNSVNHHTSFFCVATFSTLVSEYCSVAVATGVFRAKEHIVPKEQTVQSADSCVVSYVRTRRHTFSLTEKKTKITRVKMYLRMWLLKLSEHRCHLLRALKPSDAQKALSHTWWSTLPR